MKLRESYKVMNAIVVAARTLGRYSERLSAVPASILWFTPWVVPVSDRGRAKQARWLASTHPVSYQTPQGRIAGFAAGSGPRVLLVHGWGESAATLGGFVAALRGAGCRVIGMDLPAHGASSGRRTNIVQAGAAIAAVAQQEGGVKAVVAHSLGANATLWALKKENLEAERLVMLSPNVDMSYALQMFAEMFSLPATAIKGLRRSIERRFGRDIWSDLRGDVLAMGLETPGLVLHDPEDPVVPFTGSRDLVLTWRTAELAEVSGLGHGAITRDRDVIERVVRFIARSTVESAEDVSLPPSPDREPALRGAK